MPHSPPHSPSVGGSAVEQGEHAAAQEVGSQLGGQGVDPVGAGNGLHLLQRLFKGGGLPAQAAAQAVVLLQQVDVGAVGWHPADLGHGPAVGGGQADHQAVGNGKDLPPWGTVGLEKPLNGLLHPVDLRTALHEPVAHLTDHVQQLVVVELQCGIHPPFQV